MLRLCLGFKSKAWLQAAKPQLVRCYGQSIISLDGSTGHKVQGGSLRGSRLEPSTEPRRHATESRLPMDQWIPLASPGQITGSPSPHGAHAPLTCFDAKDSGALFTALLSRRPCAAGADRRGAVRRAATRRDVAAGVKAAVCVVVAAHAPADATGATLMPLAGIPRMGEDEDAPRDGALGTRRETARSSAVRRQTLCQQQPGTVLVLERQGVADLHPMSARPHQLQSQVGDAGALAEAAPGSEQGGLGAQPLRRWHCHPAQHPTGRAASLRFRHRLSSRLCRRRQRRLRRQNHPKSRLLTRRCRQSRRPPSPCLLPPRPPGRLCLGAVRVEPPSLPSPSCRVTSKGLSMSWCCLREGTVEDTHMHAASG